MSVVKEGPITDEVALELIADLDSLWRQHSAQLSLRDCGLRAHRITLTCPSHGRTTNVVVGVSPNFSPNLWMSCPGVWPSGEHCGWRAYAQTVEEIT